VASEGGVGKQKEEVLVIRKANAIVYPWAMVIHPENARAAHATVVAPVWLVFIAPLAVTAVSRPLGLLRCFQRTLRRNSFLAVNPLVFTAVYRRSYENTL